MQDQKHAAQKPFGEQVALCSPADAFKVLGVGKTKGWELIGAGALEVVKLGGRCTRIRVSSVEHLIAHGMAH